MCGCVGVGVCVGEGCMDVCVGGGGRAETHCSVNVFWGWSRWMGGCVAGDEVCICVWV